MKKPTDSHEQVGWLRLNAFDWNKNQNLLPLKYAYNITVCITTVQFIKTNVYEWMKIVLSLDSPLR